MVKVFPLTVILAAVAVSDAAPRLRRPPHIPSPALNLSPVTSSGLAPLPPTATTENPGGVNATQFTSKNDSTQLNNEIRNIPSLNHDGGDATPGPKKPPKTFFNFELLEDAGAADDDDNNEGAMTKRTGRGGEVWLDEPEFVPTPERPQWVYLYPALETHTRQARQPAPRSAGPLLPPAIEKAPFFTAQDGGGTATVTVTVTATSPAGEDNEDAAETATGEGPLPRSHGPYSVEIVSSVAAVTSTTAANAAGTATAAAEIPAAKTTAAAATSLTATA